MAHRNEGLSTQYKGDANSVKDIYDEWSDVYEADTSAWGYEAPAVVVDLLAARTTPDQQVLDVGCGTGLVGAALAAEGFHDVVGVDLSPASLDLAAKTTHYRALAEIDLTTLPTNLIDASFSALVCVGVMTYMEDVEAICREFCRIVEPFGTIVITQRSDLFESRQTRAAYDALAADGSWSIIELIEGKPYLPNHPEYSAISATYGVFERQ